MSKTYEVSIPFTGSIWTSIEADSEEEAIQLAIETCDPTLNPISELGFELDQWDLHNNVTQGNVFYGVLNEAYASCVDFFDNEDKNED